MVDLLTRRGFTRAALGAAALWALPSPLRAQDLPPIELRLAQRETRDPSVLKVDLVAVALERVELPLGVLMLEASLVFGGERVRLDLRNETPLGRPRSRVGLRIRQVVLEPNEARPIARLTGSWPASVHAAQLEARVVPRAIRTERNVHGPVRPLIGRTLTLAVARGAGAA